MSSGTISMTRRLLPAGEEFLVNTITEGSQMLSSAVSLPDDGILALWRSDALDGAEPQFFLQRFSEAGAPIGDATELVGATDAQLHSAPDGTGPFLTWSEPSASDGSPEFHIQPIAADGSFDGEDVIVEGAPRGAIGSISDGRFVITWTREDDEEETEDLYGQIISSDGSLLSDELLLTNLPEAFDDGWTRKSNVVGPVMATPDGGFAISTLRKTSSHSYDSAVSNVHWFSADGTLIGTTFLGENGEGTSISLPQIEMLQSGEMLAVWDVDDDPYASPRLVGQIFTSGGIALGDRFLVTDAWVMGRSFDVSENSSGGFFVSWTGNGTETSSTEVFGRAFAADGTPLSDERLINTHIDGRQFGSIVTELIDGSVVVMWNSDGQDGSSLGVYGQVFVDKPLPVGDAKAVGINQVGQDLFVDVSKVEDPNGIDPDTLAYNWFRDGSVIIGGTGASYRLTPDDLGAKISVRVSYEDNIGVHEDLVSLSSDPIRGEGENLIGTEGNDKLVGGAGQDLLAGGPGHDTLIGKGNYDLLVGGDGRDVLRGGSGNDILRGGWFKDRLFGNAGRDELYGGEGADELHGGKGSDTLFGGNGNDAVLGGGGKDNLSGLEGDDTLFGGDKDDTVLGGLGNDSALGEDGDDWILGEDGDDVLNGGTGNDSLFGDSGSDRLFGGSGEDLLHGGVGDDRLDGGLGRDVLYGEVGNDTLIGDGQSDRLHGGEGNDEIYGGGDRDWLSGGADGDTLYGGVGDDDLSGNSGNDVLFGGRGNDKLIGGAGRDGLHGQDGDDRLFGGYGPDKLDGGAGFDRLVGGDGGDVLLGREGDDTLRGEDGRDTLKGGRDDDKLNGGEDDDVMTGGAGTDTFVFSGGADRITDFDALNEDEKIDLRPASGIVDFNDLVLGGHLSVVGTDILITDGSGNTLTLVNVMAADLDVKDFIF